MTKKNTFKHTATSATVALVLFGTTAIAQALPQFTDSDGDGVISAAEIMQVRDARKLEMLSLYDTDGNGELSRTERRPMKDAQHEKMLQSYDADGDGELSREEHRAARDARRAIVEQQLDVNQDGEVSEAERAGFSQVREDKHAKRGDHEGPSRGERHQKGDRES